VFLSIFIRQWLCLLVDGCLRFKAARCVGGVPWVQYDALEEFLFCLDVAQLLVLPEGGMFTLACGSRPGGNG